MRKLSKMTNEEQGAMSRNGLNTSASKFDRNVLMNQLEGWLEKLKAEGQDR